MKRKIFDITANYDIETSTEIYRTAALYLLKLKLNKRLVDIEKIDYPIADIAQRIGVSFGYGINTHISSFIKRYKVWRK